MNHQRRDPDKLEDEIESTRSRIDSTLSALQQEISPGQLLDRAMGYARGHGGEFADNLVSTVSRNPVPALLTGVGLVWLAASRRSNGGHYYPLVEREDHSTSYETAGGTAYETGPSRAERVKARAEQAGASVRQGARGAREAASTAAHRSADRGRHAADRARGAARGASEQLSQWHEDNPLVMGGLAFALGAALGAATPNTRQEDELLGDYGEQLRGKAADKAREQKSRMAEQASEMGDKARENLHQAGEKSRQRQQEAGQEAREQMHGSAASPPQKRHGTHSASVQRPERHDGSGNL